MNKVVLFARGLCLLLTVLLVIGCTDQLPSVTPGNATSPESMASSVTDQSLQEELLQIQSGDYRRCGETSFNHVVETETGYYIRRNSILYYGDKSDLSNLVPVCAKPDCRHGRRGNQNGQVCDAFLLSEYLLKDHRIYYMALYDDDSPTKGLSYLASMALDGSDKREEYQLERSPDRSSLHCVSERIYLSSEMLLGCLTFLTPDGQREVVLQVVDEKGAYELFSATTQEEAFFHSPVRNMGVNGDLAYFLSCVEGSMTKAYRIRDRKLEAVELGGLPLSGSYLRGNTLQFYRPNDGYYQVDLTTRQETKLADARVDHGQACILLPNCILESSLMLDEDGITRATLDGYQHMPQGNQLWLYNGQRWLEVALPEDLVDPTEGMVLEIWAVASDRILCHLWRSDRKTDASQLYQILLGTDTPTLEYMGTIRLPGT